MPYILIRVNPTAVRIGEPTQAVVIDHSHTVLSELGYRLREKLLILARGELGGIVEYSDATSTSVTTLLVSHEADLENVATRVSKIIGELSA